MYIINLCENESFIMIFIVSGNLGDEVISESVCQSLTKIYQPMYK